MYRIGSLMLAALLVAGGAQAQDNYPTQTVKFVLPSAPGSTTDILTRLTADGLSRKWGKPTVVENIAGGSMNIGAGQVARAAPDGYTLFVAPPAPLALAHLVNKINYNPLDWVPITLLAKIANVLSVRNTLPVNTLQELIAYGKANPGKLSYATQGANSTAHLTGAYLEAQTGIKMVAIAYRGAQPALTDILAGNVDMFFDTLATSVPLASRRQAEDPRGRRSAARQGRARSCRPLRRRAWRASARSRGSASSRRPAPRPRWRSGSTATRWKCCAAPKSRNGWKACRWKPAPRVPRKPRSSLPTRPRCGAR
jgi:hypothetical protein